MDTYENKRKWILVLRRIGFCALLCLIVFFTSMFVHNEKKYQETYNQLVEAQGQLEEMSIRLEEISARLECAEADLVSFQDEIIELTDENKFYESIVVVTDPRKKWQIENNIFKLAKENLVDPEELTDVCLNSGWYDYVYGKFSPYTQITKVYTKEEWEDAMTAKYLDAWKYW